ncbi:putative duf498 domain protein [Erysiphe necator]|uniref:Putative duf498 domain protein n=1 Tax=Uncinula necator TaxID=52586 RepID=A0A0B1PAU9_UNCNE|nr:putative duf498 domain protein [Erysiphe necator]
MTSRSCQVFRSTIQNYVYQLFPLHRKLNHRYLSFQTLQRSTPCRHIRGSLLSHSQNSIIVDWNSKPFKTNSQYSSKVHKYNLSPQSNEDTRTDFGSLDILGNTPVPSTSIDACLWDGFHLNSGIKITGGMGVLLVGGKAFSWQPWIARKDNLKKLLNEKGQWEVEDETWGIFETTWPRPDLLILGLGKEMRPLSSKTSKKIHGLGIRLEIQDTRNAAAQFNLLATERGIQNIAAALIPIGWKEEDTV